jgi:hypothetical protein
MVSLRNNPYCVPEGRNFAILSTIHYPLKKLMPLPKFLQKALTALLRTVELAADPKQAVQILSQHFTLSQLLPL